MVAESLSSVLDIFKTKAPSLVGIDISSTSVKLVELSDAGKAGFRLERYAIEPLPKDVVADGNISNMDLVAASRKEKVEDRVAAAEAAGLKPRIMDVESYATQETFQLIGPSLPANGRDQNIALVDIGSHVSHFYVLRNNQFLFSRDQAFG